MLPVIVRNGPPSRYIEPKPRFVVVGVMLVAVVIGAARYAPLLAAVSCTASLASILSFIGYTVLTPRPIVLPEPPPPPKADAPPRAPRPAPPPRSAIRLESPVAQATRCSEQVLTMRIDDEDAAYWKQHMPRGSPREQSELHC